MSVLSGRRPFSQTGARSSRSPPSCCACHKCDNYIDQTSTIRSPVVFCGPESWPSEPICNNATALQPKIFLLMLAWGMLIAAQDILSGKICNRYGIIIITCCFCQEALASCRQAAVEGCHNPTPCWAHQIQARPNQWWAWRSILSPSPANRGQFAM